MASPAPAPAPVPSAPVPAPAPPPSEKDGGFPVWAIILIIVCAIIIILAIGGYGSTGNPFEYLAFWELFSALGRLA